MGLLGDLAAPKRSFPCRIRELANSLDADDAQILLDACENPKWSIIGLSRQLKERGLMVSESPIKAHRAKACSCFRA